jgi:hypothetical protein
MPSSIALTRRTSIPTAPTSVKWYQREVPFVDAMHLLALLQGAKDDVGYEEPVEAPAPEKD